MSFPPEPPRRLPASQVCKSVSLPSVGSIINRKPNDGCNLNLGGYANYPLLEGLSRANPKEIEYLMGAELCMNEWGDYPDVVNGYSAAANGKGWHRSSNIFLSPPYDPIWSPPDSYKFLGTNDRGDYCISSIPIYQG